MKFDLPVNATPHTFAHFLRSSDLSDRKEFSLSFPLHRFYVHPATIAFIAAAGLCATERGGHYLNTAGFRYLERMGLFKMLDLHHDVSLTEHDPTGRFIPLTQIRTQDQLDAAATELIPLLHTEPQAALAIRYVFSELVRNVIEHANSPLGALVCAQYYPQKGTIGLGVADAGMGIARSMAKHHPVSSSREALLLALRPGISGTTSRPGGSATNAGAGLFFSKSLARLGRNSFVVYSGDAMYKLTKGSKTEAPKLFADPAKDPHRLHDGTSGIPRWNGTVIAIDLAVEHSFEFRDLLDQIGDAYDIGVQIGKRTHHKKPKFR
jgi:hypothetical protein